MNLKLFSNHGVLHKFKKKFKKYSGEIKEEESRETSKGVSFKLILKE